MDSVVTTTTPTAEGGGGNSFSQFFPTTKDSLIVSYGSSSFSVCRHAQVHARRLFLAAGLPPYYSKSYITSRLPASIRKKSSLLLLLLLPTNPTGGHARDGRSRVPTPPCSR